VEGTLEIRRFGRFPDVQLEPKLPALRGLLRRAASRVGRIDERQQPLQPGMICW
jgi:hypothetical protein